MGAVWIKDKVLKYLADHPGLVVWRDDMAKDLNLLPSSIAAAIGNMIREGKEASTHIVVVQSGRAWRWSEKPTTPPVPPRGGGNGVASTGAPARKLYEELAVTKGGTILVQSEDGQVYRLADLDV